MGDHTIPLAGGTAGQTSRGLVQGIHQRRMPPRIGLPLMFFRWVLDAPREKERREAERDILWRMAMMWVLRLKGGG